MAKCRRIVDFGILLAAFVFTTSASAIATTLLNETFTAGSGATIGNPSGAATGTSGAGVSALPDSTQWFLATSNNGTAVYSAAQGTLQVNNQVSEATLAYFMDSGAPQTLAIGDSLTVEIRFTLQGSLGSNPLRIAILNSAGSQTNSNTSTNPTSNIYSSYKGFMASFSPGAAPAKPAIYRRNGVAGDATCASLINALTSSGTTIWTNFADSGVSATGLTADNPYRALLTVVRTSSGAMSVSFEIHDLAAPASPAVPAYSITGTSSTGNTTAFDTVVMHAGSSAARSFTLSSVIVVHTPGPPPVVATPTFNPPAGTYADPQSIAITSATTGAAVWFTIDGSAPSSGCGTLYSEPIVVSRDTTLKAIAYADGMADSEVATASYAFVAPSQASPVITEPLKAQQTVTVGRDLQLNASVSGSPSPAIVWQVSTDGGATWTNLVDDSTYRGTATATLTIVAAPAALNHAQFRYVATNASGSVTSGALVLQVVPAPFLRPTAIAVDDAGNLYVGDEATNTVKWIDTSGIVHDLAGSRGCGGAVDGVGAVARFFRPSGLAWSGVLFVADSGSSTIRCVLSGSTVMTLAGTADVNDFQDGSGGEARFNAPAGVAISSSDQIYVADTFNHVIRRLTLGGTVTTFAGSARTPGANDGIGGAARFRSPAGIAVGSDGIVYVADTENHTVRKITRSGSVSTLAGLPLTAGFSDGTGDGALFNQPTGLAVDATGNVFVADTANSTIRKITHSGVVTTFAGLAGVAGFADGTGAHALFNLPRGLAVDGAGNLYVADTGNAAIRKITPAGEATTLELTPAPVAPAPDSGSSSAAEVKAGDGAAAAAKSGGGGGALSGEFLAGLAVALVLRGCGVASRRGRNRNAADLWRIGGA